MDASILPGSHARTWFQEQLSGAIAHQQTVLGPQTELYLVNLLAQFIDAAPLFEEAPEGGREEIPLAFVLARALRGTETERAALLQALGDRALFVAGFFGDSLTRKRVDRGYYIAMGGGAYGAVATLRRAEVYAELGRKFAQIVELFSEVSERSEMLSQRGLLRLYERWIRSGSKRLTRLLVERGVIPSRGKPETLQ